MFDSDFEKTAGQAILRAKKYGPKVEQSTIEAISRAKNLFILTPEEIEGKFREQMERSESEGMI